MMFNFSKQTHINIEHQQWHNIIMFMKSVSHDFNYNFKIFENIII